MGRILCGVLVMSDDLVNRLRSGNTGQQTWIGLCEDAADRIEALTDALEKADALAEAANDFAVMANGYDGVPPSKYWGDTSFSHTYWSDTKHQVEVGQLRSARAALAAYRAAREATK